MESFSCGFCTLDCGGKIPLVRSERWRGAWRGAAWCGSTPAAAKPPAASHSAFLSQCNDRGLAPLPGMFNLAVRLCTGLLGSNLPVELQRVCVTAGIYSRLCCTLPSPAIAARRCPSVGTCSRGKREEHAWSSSEVATSNFVCTVV